MPNQLDQPGSSTTEREHRATERILGQALLHQHRKPRHAFAHIGGAARDIHAQSSGKRNHRLASTAKTRPSAAPSTSASTRRVTPPGKVISMWPPGLLWLGGGDEAGGWWCTGSCVAGCIVG